MKLKRSIQTSSASPLYESTQQLNFFYRLMSEGLHRRTMFHKLSQIYGPLIEEVKVNKDFIIMLINNKLIDMGHLQELTASGDEQQYM